MFIKYEWNINKIGDDLVFNRAPENGACVGAIGQDYYTREDIRVKPVFDEDRFMINKYEQVVGIGGCSKGTHAVAIDLRHGQYTLYRMSKGGWVPARNTHRH